MFRMRAKIQQFETVRIFKKFLNTSTATTEKSRKKVRFLVQQCFFFCKSLFYDRTLLISETLDRLGPVRFLEIHKHFEIKTCNEKI